MTPAQNIAWTRPVSRTDSQGFFLAEEQAELDVYAKDGSYLVPGGCIDAEPPESREGFAARWNGSGWDYLPDLRGRTAWRTADRQAVRIETVGSLEDLAAAQGLAADGLTLIPPPSDAHDWHEGAWQENPERAAALAQSRLHAARVRRLAELNRAAQDVVRTLAGLDETPDFEVQTWPVQAAEAKARHADPSAPTPTLDAIAAARGVPAELLRQKAYEKTVRYEAAAARIVGLRQRYQDRIEAAENPEEIEALVFDFAQTA